MKKKWGVLRTAVILAKWQNGKIGPKVSAEDDKCPSSSKSLVYPYPTKFTKPGYPTKFDKPQPYPTEFIKPNQIQTETQTNEATFMSKWENAIHQLIVQANQSKGPAVCVSAPETENASEPAPEDEGTLTLEAKPESTETEPAVSARFRWGKVAHQLVNENNRRKRSVAPATCGPQSVSYSPSLPAPEGPFPPPAFAYNSPAHGPKIISEPELASAPENAPTLEPGELASSPVPKIYPPLPSPPSSPPVITYTSPAHETKTTTKVGNLCTSKVKTA